VQLPANVAESTSIWRVGAACANAKNHTVHTMCAITKIGVDVGKPEIKGTRMTYAPTVIAHKTNPFHCRSKITLSLSRLLCRCESQRERADIGACWKILSRQGGGDKKCSNKKDGEQYRRFEDEDAVKPTEPYRVFVVFHALGQCNYLGHYHRACIRPQGHG
jgi:hypothetical protein